VATQDTVVGWLLRSPAHGLVSGALVLVRYQGRRSGRTVATPTQYARSGDDLVIVVGRPDTKTWWRNFEDERDLDVLIRRRWVAHRGRAIRGAAEPDVAGPLLDAYLARFPRTARALGDDDPAERLASAVLVRCRPR
jgi:hypothetical protein